MKDEKKISSAVIKRLPKYYRYLLILQQMGISRVSSNDLSKRMEITSSQVRQDFFNFGGFGLQGYGYDVTLLVKEIGNILGMDKINNMIVIGAGNLGQAIANHTSFEKRGFKIVGMFDNNPRHVGDIVRGIEIMHSDRLTEFMSNHSVDIAIITVPREYAREVVDKVVKLGIKGLWNFASVELEVPDDVAVENIHLSESLMALTYKMKEIRNRKAKVLKKTESK
ncbi:MAG TPA: redox-sensing transcriptional repressor Rex [Peptococcaceae bacterium]|nr:redox-sensing transcriptional repressor Rex [Peptococcaceae bacterium]